MNIRSKHFCQIIKRQQRIHMLLYKGRNLVRKSTTIKRFNNRIKSFKSQVMDSIQLMTLKLLFLQIFLRCLSIWSLMILSLIVISINLILDSLSKVKCSFKTIISLKSCLKRAMKKFHIKTLLTPLLCRFNLIRISHRLWLLFLQSKESNRFTVIISLTTTLILTSKLREIIWILRNKTLTFHNTQRSTVKASPHSANRKANWGKDRFLRAIYKGESLYLLHEKWCVIQPLSWRIS